MSNFSFLKSRSEYSLFSSAAIEAEKVYSTAPAMCAVGSRKALELAVKWVYAADNTMAQPYKDNLQALIHEPSFRFAVDAQTWGKLPYIVRLGNLAVHTERAVQPSDALLSLQGLFEFIQWIDYCYGSDYEERTFDETIIPAERVALDVEKIKQQRSLLDQKDSEIKRLQEQIERLSAQYTAEKEQHKEKRTFSPDEDISEFETRKRYIDVDLKSMGWLFSGPDSDVEEEYEVNDMEGHLGQKGYVDYVLWGKDHLPLALIEAKRTSKDANVGKTQAFLYADCLERRFHRRPMIFTTNGFDTFFWDDKTSPQRKVSGVFSKDTLQKLMNRRTQTKKLLTIPIDDRITDRYYQKEAIRAVCDHIESGFRKHLLVMATGTGKTRTASSLVDVLSRGNHVTNVLFLADRRALVKQAKDDFKNYLPKMSLCNLIENKDDRAARIVFSTYPTILNTIDAEQTGKLPRLFTPAYFDLIVLDEAHRSIFKKYRAIFDYFDAHLVGLTATPVKDVGRNTYDFFELPVDLPTYAYEYETARDQDKVLVPYHNIEVGTQFMVKGIEYDSLSEEDKERYEADFAEDEESPPAFIPSSDLNKFIFNQKTVDTVLQDLMTNGVKVAGGARLAKTIIFAQNKEHASYILKRFDDLYPHLKGGFARRVVCDDAYAQSVIDDFKQPAPPTHYCLDLEKEPHIVISVDMMDTGIDVPHIGNLVFFKQVRSKTKFWQMIGRGTRKCDGMECVDSLDGEYVNKRRFYIFDYCGNFEFFRANKNGIEGKELTTPQEAIFSKRVCIIHGLQNAAFAEEKYQAWREELVAICQGQINDLNPQLTAVHLALRYVEKYKQPGSFQALGEAEKGELIDHIAPIVAMDEKDFSAISFDNFMYGLILMVMQQLPGIKKARKRLTKIAASLEQRISIPQIREKLPLIQTIHSDELWSANDVFSFETLRRELRDLIKYIIEPGKPPIYTSLTDPILFRKEGEELEPGYDFEDYKLKVGRYVAEHPDTMAIYKLTHNVPMSQGDYHELERVLTQELGTAEDYKREYGETPFGLLIRRIAKMDHEAAMSAFSAFINDESLNQQQINFIHMVIRHIEQNGYVDEVADLFKPPFDRPVSFLRLFDPKRQSAIVETVKAIKENATRIA